ncbi:MAG TPA: flippase-like domain-containing protein [Micrococcaceae bacterium]
MPVVALLIWFVVVPQYSAAAGAFATVRSLSVPLVLSATALEAASLLSFSILTAVVLGYGRPRYFTLLFIDLTDLGVNHVLPGGGTTAAAFRYRLLTWAGVPPREALTAAAMEMTGSNLALGVLFATGVLLSFSLAGDIRNYLAAGLSTLAMLAASAAAVWILVRHPGAAARFLRALARRVPFLHEDRVDALVWATAEQVRGLVTVPARMAAVAVFGLLNWVLDAAALWVFLMAFGSPLAIGPLLTVYGLASILAMLPLTPGGLGIVEGVLIPSLAGFGVPGTTALLAVVGWRVVEFWLPIPVGAGAYVALRLTARRGPHRSPPRTALPR